MHIAGRTPEQHELQHPHMDGTAVSTVEIVLGAAEQRALMLALRNPDVSLATDTDDVPAPTRKQLRLMAAGLNGGLVDIMVIQGLHGGTLRKIGDKLVSFAQVQDMRAGDSTLGGSTVPIPMAEMVESPEGSTALDMAVDILLHEMGLPQYGRRTGANGF